MNEKGSFTPEETKDLCQHDLEFDTVPSDLESRFESLDTIKNLTDDLGKLSLNSEKEFLLLDAKNNDVEVAYRSEADGQTWAKLILRQDAEIVARKLAKATIYQINIAPDESDPTPDSYSIGLAIRAALDKNGLHTPIQIIDQSAEVDPPPPSIEEAYDIANLCELLSRAMAAYLVKIDKKMADQGQARLRGYVVNRSMTEYLLNMPNNKIPLDLQSLRLATLAAARRSGLDTDIIFADEPSNE